MCSLDTGRGLLTVTPDTITFGDSQLSVESIETVAIELTDTYVNGAWVNGTRVVELISMEESPYRRIQIDCSELFPNREVLDERYAAIYGAIWSVVGPNLVGKVLSKLANEGKTSVASVQIDRDGVWVNGSWKILWFKARPRLIPWTDLTIYSNDGILFLQSRSNLAYRTDLKMNNKQNVVVLDATVRYLLQDNNWRQLSRRSVAQATGTKPPGFRAQH